jgi:hypothetical protein
MASFTTAAGTVVSLSAMLKSRPATSAVPVVAK